MKLYLVLLFLPLLAFSSEYEMKNVEFEMGNSAYKEDYYKFKKNYLSKFFLSSDSKRKYFSKLLVKFRKNSENYNLDVAWMDLKFSWITVDLMKEYESKSSKLDEQLKFLKERLLKRFPNNNNLIEIEFARYKEQSEDTLSPLFKEEVKKISDIDFVHDSLKESFRKVRIAFQSKDSAIPELKKIEELSKVNLETLRNLKKNIYQTKKDSLKSVFKYTNIPGISNEVLSEIQYEKDLLSEEHSLIIEEYEKTLHRRDNLLSLIYPLELTSNGNFPKEINYVVYLTTVAKEKVAIECSIKYQNNKNFQFTILSLTPDFYTPSIAFYYPGFYISSVNGEVITGNYLTQTQNKTTSTAPHINHNYNVYCKDDLANQLFKDSSPYKRIQSNDFILDHQNKEDVSFHINMNINGKLLKKNEVIRIPQNKLYITDSKISQTRVFQNGNFIALIDYKKKGFTSKLEDHFKQLGKYNNFIAKNWGSISINNKFDLSFDKMSTFTAAHTELHYLLIKKDLNKLNEAYKRAVSGAPSEFKKQYLEMIQNRCKKLKIKLRIEDFHE